jgi:DnaJ-class molecular chaperone
MKPRNRYEEISAACKILGLSQSATMAEIRQRYRNLISRWHPDVCPEQKEVCEKMAARINEAYRCIRAYCDHYEYSFSREQVEKSVSPGEWWYNRFGKAPMWGQPPNGEK